MVAGKLQQQMQKQTTTPRSQKTAEIANRKQTPLPLHPPPLPLPSSRTVFSRSFGVYFPRATAQVQPRPPGVTELIKLVEELKDREARLKTEILGLKLVNESAVVLDKEIEKRDSEVEKLNRRVEELEIDNRRLKSEVVEMRRRLEAKTATKAIETTSKATKTTAFLKMGNEVRGCEEGASMTRRARENVKVNEMTTLATNETTNVAKETTAFAKMNGTEDDEMSRRFQGLIDASVKSNLIRSLKKSAEATATATAETKPVKVTRSSGGGEVEDNNVKKSQTTRVSKPILKSACSISAWSPSQTPTHEVLPSQQNGQSMVPPPPPPPPAAMTKMAVDRVRRVPEVVEFYHWLMRRDTRREPGGGVEAVAATTQGSNSRDMIGEIENRSAYSLAIKTDVETKGDFIRMLIKEVKNSMFSSIEDVLPFVKWLDEELSLLVDERAVLKHFDWPEQKADALREAAFGYSDLKKLKSEASDFRDDPRQSCGSALKKMQALFEKLEQGIYNLSHLRESASKKYKMHRIPLDWMLETGLVNQIKLASVKLAMKYMNRVSAELQSASGGSEDVELVVRGVKFAFRVHQFAGGFDAETMNAFKELKDKARTCGLQCHSHQ